VGEGKSAGVQRDHTGPLGRRQRRLRVVALGAQRRHHRTGVRLT
jgi:hypothetical protein